MRRVALVTGITAVFVVLALGVAASTWEAVQARRAQKVAEQQTRAAERQTAIAKAVNDFLQNDLLGQASLYNQAKPDPNLSVRTVLDGQLGDPHACRSASHELQLRRRVANGLSRCGAGLQRAVIKLWLRQHEPVSSGERCDRAGEQVLP